MDSEILIGSQLSQEDLQTLFTILVFFTMRGRGEGEGRYDTMTRDDARGDKRYNTITRDDGRYDTIR